MGAESRAKRRRRLSEQQYAELNAVIVAAQRAGKDAIKACAEYLATATGQPQEACEKKVRQWLGRSQ